MILVGISRGRRRGIKREGREREEGIEFEFVSSPPPLLLVVAFSLPLPAAVERSPHRCRRRRRMALPSGEFCLLVAVRRRSSLLIFVLCAG